MLESNIKVVLFDLWHTLIYGLSTDPIQTFWEALADTNEGCPSEFMRLCHTTNIAEPGRFVEALAAEFSCEPTASVKEAFARLIAEERRLVSAYPDSLATLDGLVERGIRLGVISNLWPFPVSRIEELLALPTRVEASTYSFEVGFNKPSAEIFEAAVARLGVSADQCLMVGDSLSSDIEGATAFGMEAALICREAQIGQFPVEVPAGVHAIASLSDLLS